MTNFYIDPDWTFKQVVSNLFFIKDDYLRGLSSFLWHELKERNDFIRQAKNKIYSLSFEVWKKDRIWDYLNDSIDFSVLINIL